MPLIIHLYIYILYYKYLYSGLYIFSKCVNVIRVQCRDRYIDESIFRTIYIIVRASYVNVTAHYGTI